GVGDRTEHGDRVGGVGDVLRVCEPLGISMARDDVADVRLLGAPQQVGEHLGLNVHHIEEAGRCQRRRDRQRVDADTRADLENPFAAPGLQNLLQASGGKRAARHEERPRPDVRHPARVPLAPRSGGYGGSEGDSPRGSRPSLVVPREQREAEHGGRHGDEEGPIVWSDPRVGEPAATGGRGRLSSHASQNMSDDSRFLLASVWRSRVMHAARRTLPRKRAKQDRAKATVEAILTAAAHILVREGFDAANTNRIAEKAGVSIGSLYQYFPGKEAVVAALLERHVRQMLRTAEHGLERSTANTLRGRAREMVRTMLDAHAVEPGLHRVFMEEMPRFGQLQEVVELERMFEEVARRHMERERSALRPRNLEIAAFVVVQTVEALTHAAVLHRPDMLRSEAFVDEVTELIVRYL